MLFRVIVCCQLLYIYIERERERCNKYIYIYIDMQEPGVGKGGGTTWGVPRAGTSTFVHAIIVEVLWRIAEMCGDDNDKQVLPRLAETTNPRNKNEQKFIKILAREIP